MLRSSRSKQHTLLLLAVLAACTSGGNAFLSAPSLDGGT
jgi:hypothetical protein